VRKQKRQQIIQIVDSRDRQTDFLEKSFEIFLGRLLAVKTDEIPRSRLISSQTSGAVEILFGLLDPPRGFPFHRVPCPFP
jgi:hypothetical protein